MKKLLVLTEITFKTGDNTYTRNHLVLTEVPHDATQNDLSERACKVVLNNFKEWYPESKIESVVPVPTISDLKSEPEELIEMYSRDALVRFGTYLLSDERKERIMSNERPDGKPYAFDNDRLKDVYHADVENWRAIEI